MAIGRLFTNQITQCGFESARVLFGNAHRTRDLVYSLESIAFDVADDEIGIRSENTYHRGAEFLEKRFHLVMRQPEAGQVRSDFVFITVGNPRFTQ